MKETPGINETIQHIEQLGLPGKIIFLDVNGTLIPENVSKKPNIVGLLFDQIDLRVAVAPMVKREGTVIGLCSDSPLPQLVKFAQEWGIGDGPIAAENGNVVLYNGQKAVVNPFPGIASYKEQISELAKAAGYDQGGDVVAPEFGGLPPKYIKGQWAFGANRQTSISVFGPPRLIDLLGYSLDSSLGVSFDVSAVYNYFAIHPGDVKKNKGALLAELAILGHSILMVGNSASDWVDPITGVQCAFVGGSRITQEMKEKATYCSDCPAARGVVDILQKIKL